MGNSLRKLAYSRYKQNRFTSWILGVITGLFLAVLVGLDLLMPGLIIVVFPFLICPFFLAMILSFFAFRFDGQLTLGKHFNYFFAYFGHPFKGCFRVLVNVLKAILTCLILIIVCSFVYSTILSITNPDSLAQINELVMSYMANEEITYVNSIEEIFPDGVFKVIEIIGASCSCLAIIYMFYRICFESIGVYARMNLVKVNPAFIKLVISSFFSQNRKKYRKDFISLNWPLFLLMIVGSGVGLTLSVLFVPDLTSAPTFAIIGGFIFTSFFFPFYFFNMETLFEKYESCFKTAMKDVSQEIINRIKSEVDMSQEEISRLSKTINDELDNDDKDNKKDPTGS